MHWIANVKGGPRRVNHAAVVVNDLIFSFGGYCSSEDYRSLYTIDVQVLNTHTLRWSKVKPHPLERGRIYPEVPFKRYGHTAVLYKHLVYIWGGRNDEMCCNVLFAFDTRTLRWVKPTVNGRVPGVRDGHSACVVGHCMYVFGGFEEEINQFSRDVHCLNLETMTWSFVETCGEPPSYRDFHTATVLNDRMYVFGGRGDWNSPYHTQDEFYCERIVYLDLKTSMWHMPKTTGQVPVGRRSHSAIVYNGKLIVFGGYHSVLDLHFNDVNSFDPATNCWSLLSTRGREPRPRRRQVCLMVGDRMFMFGGTR